MRAQHVLITIKYKYHSIERRDRLFKCSLILGMAIKNCTFRICGQNTWSDIKCLAGYQILGRITETYVEKKIIEIGCSKVEPGRTYL